MIKLGLLVIGVLLAVFGVIFGLTSYLSENDTPQKSEAIVAVSGGDTLGRADKAIELYLGGYAPLLVFSGAAKDPNSPSNARVMQQAALARGVPASAIRLEEYSRDTKENAQLVKDILAESEKVILVTSPYHQRRAAKELQKALPKTTIINVSAEDKHWSPQTWWVTPYGWWITLSEAIKSIL